MNISPAATADYDLRYGSSSNRILAHVTGTFDIEGVGIQSAKLELTAGPHLGRRQGWSRKDDAIKAVALLTENNPLVGGLVKEGDRYVAYEMKVKSLSPNSDVLDGQPFEYIPYSTSTVDVRTKDRSDDFVALVDGNTFAQTWRAK